MKPVQEFIVHVFLFALLLYAFRLVLILLFRGIGRLFPGMSAENSMAWFWSLQALAVMVNFRYRSDPLYVLEWLLAFALSLFGGTKGI